MLDSNNFMTLYLVPVRLLFLKNAFSKIRHDQQTISSTHWKFYKVALCKIIKMKVSKHFSQLHAFRSGHRDDFFSLTIGIVWTTYSAHELRRAKIKVRFDDSYQLSVHVHQHGKPVFILSVRQLAEMLQQNVICAANDVQYSMYCN